MTRGTPPHRPSGSRLTFRWIGRPTAGRFLERLNRFACLVEGPDGVLRVHLPNSGRLEELLRPGAEVLLDKRRSRGKTHFDLLLVRAPRYPDGEPIWVGLDSRLPPLLLRWVLEDQMLAGLGPPRRMAMEPRDQHGRFDLRAELGGQAHLFEAKSVNLVDTSGVARFPDAPTTRGTRHVERLRELCSQGHNTWLVFVVLREDARAFSPLRDRDPAFAEAVVSAAEAGVRVVALRFSAGPDLEYQGALDCILPPPDFPGSWPPESGVEVRPPAAGA